MPNTTNAENMAALTIYDSVNDRFRASFKKGVRNPLIPTPKPITKNKTPTINNGMISVFLFLEVSSLLIILIK
jgi:hypothetical protein